jgi:3-demethoxyubiquinol 3-hydroxylase
MSKTGEQSGVDVGIASWHRDAIVADSAITVWYDGSCPLCRREISVYQGQSSQRPINWLDVSDSRCAIPSGFERDELMKRFHVRTSTGQVVSGAAAFVSIWSELPGWRYLAALAKLPGALGLMEWAYQRFLLVRPLVQRIVRQFDVTHLPASLIGDLRSDHAGETGAVWIYRGVLMVARDAALRQFAANHLATEQQHLAALQSLLPTLKRSKLLVPWRIAGFLTGFIPALFGARAVYATIHAVETFVDTHYQAQIEALDRLGTHDELKATLLAFQRDECAHRDEAADRLNVPPGRVLSTWCRCVGKGSALAVRLARIA